MVLKGPSMSLLTGPNRDHTTRNATGGYIIAQGFSAIFLSEFRFYSPAVDLTWSDDYCLRNGTFSFFSCSGLNSSEIHFLLWMTNDSFWYLMFGKDIMSLKVEMDVPMFRRGKQQLFSKTNERSARKYPNYLLPSTDSAYNGELKIDRTGDMRK